MATRKNRWTGWPRTAIFLTFLVPKLPAPTEDDLSKGILEAIDMDSYRVEKQAVRDLLLPDEDAEIEPVSTSGGGQKPEPEMERLSNIIREFNDRFGNIEWQDQDKSLRRDLCGRGRRRRATSARVACRRYDGRRLSALLAADSPSSALAILQTVETLQQHGRVIRTLDLACLSVCPLFYTSLFPGGGLGYHWGHCA